MSDTNDFLRYSCQIALPGFSVSAQVLLKQSRVLVVGAGGLGCPAAQYLAAAGTGNLGIADDDVVSVSNLHRQVLYTPADAGAKKAAIAAEKLQQQNPGIKITPHLLKVTSKNVLTLMGDYDIIVDCTDNFETRYLLNDAAFILKKPLVYGAIYQFEGQAAVWNVKNADGTYSPNYRDIFPKVDASQIPNCAVGGVIPTLAGIIGCIQANEVIKYITRTADLLSGKMLVFDAQSMQSRIIKLSPSTKTNITALEPTADITAISASELKAGLEHGNFELVDVRTLQERDAHDIGGVHIPLDELDDHINYFAGDTPKVLFCASGKRSAEAVKLIKQKLPEAKVFSLGLNDYTGLF